VSAAFHAEATKLEPSALVSLFQLDATRIDGPIYHFTTETRGGAMIRFGGVDFHAVPVRMTGMSVSGQGPIQTPTLSVGNTDGFIQQIVNSLGNLEHCKLTRWRTFARHLDDGEAPDPTAVYGPDVYVIDRKSADTPEVIEWELSALVDQQGVYIGRTVVRDTCLWRYREFDTMTGQFDYSKAVCPYTGSAYFDRENKPVSDPSLDVPARNLRCCRVRFGEDAVLPFGGFPGVVRGL
jgi:lambda family phage minor tail protein L